MNIQALIQGVDQGLVEEWLLISRLYIPYTGDFSLGTDIYCSSLFMYACPAGWLRQGNSVSLKGNKAMNRVRRKHKDRNGISYLRQP
eukprot:1188698-Prorocentrum_minimum.AAC.4